MFILVAVLYILSICFGNISMYCTAHNNYIIHKAGLTFILSACRCIICNFAVGGGVVEHENTDTIMMYTLKNVYSFGYLFQKVIVDEISLFMCLQR